MVGPFSVRGCKTHDSIVRCPPGNPCTFPSCRGRIPPLAEGERWNRNDERWRADPPRVPR